MMCLSDRTIRHLSMLGAASCLLMAVALSPPILASLATADGRIDNSATVITLWITSFILLVLGALATMVAHDVSRARRIALQLWKWKWRIAAWIAAAIGLSVIALAIYIRIYNHVDLLARLNSDHSLYAKVQDALRTNGKKAALDLVADYFMKRPAPLLIKPSHLWDIGSVKSQASARRIIDGDLGSACCDLSPECCHRTFHWRPGEPINWSTFEPRDLLFALQRQTFVSHLLVSEHGNPDPRLLDIAKVFMKDWRRANRVWPNFNPFAWNDDATSNRIQAHMLLMEVLRAQGRSTHDDELAFLRSLLQHAARLMDESEHNYVTNHGMMQNSALLAIAIAYPEFDQGRQWQRTAIERMKRHLQDSVTPEGVFLELTPAYHLFATQMTLWFVAACQKANIEMDPFFETTLRRMLIFSREILNPDRSLPVIADTGNGHRWGISHWPWESLPDWPELTALQDAMSHVDQPPNEPTARLWPQSGYFVLRVPAPDWTLDQALMLTLKAGPLSRAHMHYDQLSVTLFGHGQPLLTGPGYPRGDPATRAQLIATISQNTVSVDGLSQKPGAAKVLFYDLQPQDVLNRQGPEFVAIQAESLLYEGVTHHRILFYGPTAGAVLMVDELSSKDEHTYRQHFRMAPGLEGRPKPGSLLVHDPSKPAELLLRIDVWSWSDNSITRPPLSISEQAGTFTVNSRNATFVALLDLSEGSETKNVTVRNGSLLWQGQRGTLNINLPITSPQSYQWIPVKSSD